MRSRIDIASAVDQMNIAKKA